MKCGVRSMLHGIAVSEGIGLGRVMVLEEHSLVYDEGRPADAAAEQERFQQAVEDFCHNTAGQVEQLRLSAGREEAQILEAHIDMVRDPVLNQEVMDLVDQGCRAETALKEVCGGYIEAFSNAHDELVRLRAEDIRDVCNALLCLLLGVEEVHLDRAPKGTVLVARELSPSLMSQVDTEKIVGIIIEKGGVVSHACILARTMGVPMVCGIAGAAEQLADGAFVIVDGSKGEVICSPEESVTADYWQKRQEYQEERRCMEYYKERKTLSADGGEYALYCNITLPCGAAGALEAGGEGVGLFRTEYLFMNRQTPPTEEEQIAAYSQALQGAAGHPVVIRTLDIGGDKDIPCLSCEKEENPFLGLRGVRWCLRHEEVFLTQLRALLRAGAGQNLRLMVPMVSTQEELRACRGLLEKAREQLMGEGKPCAQKPPLGIMIETPAAAAMAAWLCREADFFSIGTNDLTSYVMACDRGNPQTAELYSPLQPAVLQVLRSVIRCAGEGRIPVSICGEAASDPRLIPLLMAFGINGFSVPAASVLAVRKTVSQWTRGEVQKLAKAVLQLGTLAEVEGAMAKAVGARS